MRLPICSAFDVTSQIRVLIVGENTHTRALENKFAKPEVFISDLFIWSFVNLQYVRANVSDFNWLVSLREALRRFYLGVGIANTIEWLPFDFFIVN